MQITGLRAVNYKSLRDVSFAPQGLSVVVGANAAGKSNFADFFDFLSDLYRHGLSVAVARKGGYENIAHRKMRRSRGALCIEITAVFDKKELRKWGPLQKNGLSELRFSHKFSFKAEGQSIRADFRIEHETITLERKVSGRWTFLAEITRKKDGVVVRKSKDLEESKDRPRVFSLARQFRFIDRLGDFGEEESLSPTELALGAIGRFTPILRMVSNSLASIRVIQVSPTNARDFGVPIPDPEMDRHGSNLPAVVDMLIKRHGQIWGRITDIMRMVIPGLEKIDVDYTHSRTLGLYFYEEGVGRPWNVAEVSDGTIHSLALLVALFDPRSSMLVLEEPENSVHTWILRALMEAAKDAAKKKQILLTTHSRIVVDTADPIDVWVMWRSSGESHLAALSALDSDVISMVEEGDSSTFELLDTGLITEALPPEPKS